MKLGSFFRNEFKTILILENFYCCVNQTRMKIQEKKLHLKLFVLEICGCIFVVEIFDQNSL